MSDHPARPDHTDPADPVVPAAEPSPPRGHSMLEILRRDSARYVNLGGWASSPGFWVGAIFRFGVWAHGLRSVLLRIPVLTLYRIIKLPWRILLNVYIPPSVRIGPGLCLIHPNNILIAPNVIIGEDCLIFHEVTLGTGPSPGVPKIGNGVDIYVGARVLGGVVIGDDSMIGANCVVTRSVASGSVVVAAPTRIVPRSLARVARTADERAGADPR
jgi:serine O-acetyltransferase